MCNSSISVSFGGTKLLKTANEIFDFTLNSIPLYFFLELWLEHGLCDL